MSKALALLAVVLVTCVGAAGAAGAPPVFKIVASEPAATLPSAEAPNAPGSLVLPPSYLERRESDGLPFATLNGLWQRAGATYGIPWEVLAAINKIESNFGRNMGPSSAGAIGWMQFMPSTWLRWGTDANGDGLADPWNAEDAVYSAARYLAAAGGRTDLERGIFAYNHAQWYVDDVLRLARLYGHGGAQVAFSFDRLQVQLDTAREAVSRANRRLVAAKKRERAIGRRARSLHARVDSARLLSERLALLKNAVQADGRHDEASTIVTRLRKRLERAEELLAEARSNAVTSSFASGAGTLIAAPLYQGDYVFPVGGGPEAVSVGHYHHDYPAADIAAASGAPLYALADGVVVDAWPSPNGACGIGFKLQTADGRAWTYCHLSYLEPAVQPGVVLTAGAPVGLVGSTGHSTGPHLHLQLNPPSSYPQDEAWFQGFAGKAFHWLDAPTPYVGAGPPVFTIVEDAKPISGEGSVIMFTAERS
ncbi:MAG TPA: lytic murein transglycosylase [Gaiellaceae bacterium]|jgi:murein DD-endopeptidase MepM/ murein hydrolase activator NlpD|nr:lytic murein transglycosylase [Gaiellaceae bacterium]